MPASTQRTPHLVAILGDIGAGKTALMTHLLRKDYMNGHNIIATYKLYFPKYKGCPEIHDSKDYDKVHVAFKEDLPFMNNATVGFDELQMGADARLGVKGLNRRLSYIAMQARKRDLDIIFTAQRNMHFDIRFRDLVSKIILVEQVHHDPVTIKCVFIDPKTVEKISSIYFYPDQELFDSYDTKEIIKEPET